MIKQLDEISHNAISGEFVDSKAKDAEALRDNLRQPLKKSIEELDALLSEHGGWRGKSGLVLVTSKKDGKSEYLLEEDAAVFENGTELIASEPAPLPQQPSPVLGAKALEKEDAVEDRLPTQPDEIAAYDPIRAAKGLNDNAHGIDRFGYRVCSYTPLLL